MTDIATALDTAADVLERDGWCQGRLHRWGAHCARGALDVATGVVAVYGASGEEYLAASERSYAAEVALQAYLGVAAVPCWNDADGRTADEVIAALRTAALLQRAAETPAGVAA